MSSHPRCSLQQRKTDASNRLTGVSVDQPLASGRILPISNHAKLYISSSYESKVFPGEIKIAEELATVRRESKNLTSMRPMMMRKAQQ